MVGRFLSKALFFLMIIFILTLLALKRHYNVSVGDAFGILFKNLKIFFV
jgi:preprotein translocase subunit SecG